MITYVSMEDINYTPRKESAMLLTAITATGVAYIASAALTTVSAIYLGTESAKTIADLRERRREKKGKK